MSVKTVLASLQHLRVVLHSDKKIFHKAALKRPCSASKLLRSDFLKPPKFVSAKQLEFLKTRGAGPKMKVRMRLKKVQKFVFHWLFG